MFMNYWFLQEKEPTKQGKNVVLPKKNIRRQDCQHHCYLLVSFSFKFKIQCTVQLSTPQSVVDTYKVEKGEMTASTFMIMRHEHAHEKRKRVDIFYTNLPWEFGHIMGIASDGCNFNESYLFRDSSIVNCVQWNWIVS